MLGPKNNKWLTLKLTILFTVNKLETLKLLNILTFRFSKYKFNSFIPVMLVISYLIHNF